VKLLTYEQKRLEDIVKNSLSKGKWNHKFLAKDFFSLFKVRLNALIDLCYGESGLV
jgi:hypothetical protein